MKNISLKLSTKIGEGFIESKNYIGDLHFVIKKSKLQNKDIHILRYKNRELHSRKFTDALAKTVFNSKFSKIKFHNTGVFLNSGTRTISLYSDKNNSIIIGFDKAYIDFVDCDLYPELETNNFICPYSDYDKNFILMPIRLENKNEIQETLKFINNNVKGMANENN